MRPRLTISAWIARVLFVLIATPLVVVLLVPTARSRVRTFLILGSAVPGSPVSLLERFTDPPVVKELTVFYGKTPLPADFYLPARVRRPLPAIVFAHGNVPEGRKEARMVKLAQSLARGGIAVLLPEIPTFAQYTFQAADIPYLRDAFRVLTAQPEVDPRRVGMGGISFSASFVMLAATDPLIANDVRAIFALGAYGDLTRLVEAMVTQHVPQSGRTFEATDGARKIVKENLLVQLPRRQHRTVEQAFKVGNLLRVHAALPALRTVLEPLRRTLSPEAHLDSLRAPVFLLASETDRTVPYEESISLAATRSADHARVLVTPLFSHVTYQAPPGERFAAFRAILRDGRALLRFTDTFFRTLRTPRE